ncbi:MAG: hypothetical protein RMJ39_10230, partial [Deltaproteobacteria bacterium]|nr:hypothetical protein [Deltaproteobacteria bacterium]
VKDKKSLLSITFSPNGKFIAIGSENGEVLLLQFNERELREYTKISFGNPVKRLIFSSDSKFLIVATDTTVAYPSARISLLSLEQKKIVYTSGLLDSPPSVQGLAIKPNSNLIARTGGAPGISLWQIEDNRLIYKQELSTKILWGISMDASFSSDGDFFASGTREFVQIWRMSDKMLLCEWAAHKRRGPIAMDTVKFSRISPDGSFLITGALKDNTIKIWNIEKIKHLKNISK